MFSRSSRRDNSPTQSQAKPSANSPTVHQPARYHTGKPNQSGPSSQRPSYTSTSIREHTDSEIYSNGNDYSNGTEEYQYSYLAGSYFPTTPPIHAESPPSYDNYLFIDGENDTEDSSYRQSPLPQNRPVVCYPPNTQPPTQCNCPRADETPYSPTERWSAEDCSEERIRLGLPRLDAEQQHLEQEQKDIEFESNRRA